MRHRKQNQNNTSTEKVVCHQHQHYFKHEYQLFLVNHCATKPRDSKISSSTYNDKLMNTIKDNLSQEWLTKESLGLQYYLQLGLNLYAPIMKHKFDKSSSDSRNLSFMKNQVNNKVSKLSIDEMTALLGCQELDFDRWVIRRRNDIELELNSIQSFPENLGIHNSIDNGKDVFVKMKDTEILLWH